MSEKVITSSNAGLCTAFEIRQELMKRGAMDIPDDQINFKSLLKRLMVELVADESRAEEERTKVVVDKASEERLQRQAEREKRKQEAMERSRLRQADPNYFLSKNEVNRKSIEDSKLAERSDVVGDVEVSSAEVEEGPEENRNTPTDPFRSYSSKSRSRIYVK